MFGWLRKNRKIRCSVPQDQADCPEAERELRRYFAGRRAGRRRRVSLQVELTGTGQALRGWTVDLSCTGALFRIDEQEVPRDIDLASFSGLVGESFADKLFVSFGGGTLKRRMEVVRTTVGGLGGEVFPLLACRFQVPLNNKSCDLLGIAPRDRHRSLQIMLLDE
jgi:hypothetical protein